MNTSPKHTLITSFNKQGYERYGKDFLESLDFWPENIRVVVYYESSNSQDPVDFDFPRRVLIHDFWDVEHMEDWFDKIWKFKLMSGGTDDIDYNINFDARQARKVFMQAHAIKTYGGKVFWVDADVITHSSIPKTFLDFVLPDDKLCCYLGRDWFHTESGFIGFNADHESCDLFMKAYKKTYLDGVIFTRPGWHDCWGFDVVREWVGKKEAFNDLAQGLPKTMHPFVNSILGKYMDHRKGTRKDDRTSKDELVVPRPEPYWA